MSVFADSSALVKLYADEPGCAEIRALTDVVVSQVARVEVPAAIWRKHRMGGLTAEEAATLAAEFEADWFGDGSAPERFAIVALTSAVLDNAARFAAVHGLRAHAAAQLASSVAARAADPDLVVFAAYDTSLAAAAAAEGFALSYDPGTHRND